MMSASERGNGGAGQGRASRREVLQGVGGTVTLPWLASGPVWAAGAGRRGCGGEREEGGWLEGMWWEMVVCL